MEPIVVVSVISLVLVIIGALVMFASRGNLKRRRRIIDTPTSPIARAAGLGPVEIKGRVVPCEQGLIAGPFSGRQGVYVRVVVEEYRSSGKHGQWRTVFDQSQSREFFVDDGSGQLARVMSGSCKYVLDCEIVQSSGTFQNASPQVESFLSAYGMKSTTWLGFNKRMRYQEEMLCAGDPLYALGPSMRRPAGPPQHDGYRAVQGTQLVMYGGATEDEELLLTNKTEEQLVANLRTGFVVGAVLAGVGALGALGTALVVLAMLAASVL